MKNIYEELPAGYKKAFSIDLQKDKKLMLLVNGIALLITVLMAALTFLIIPISELVDAIHEDVEFQSFAISMLALIVSMILYMVLHEAVHGITMKLYGTAKVKYGFTGLYAFAGSEAYYAKKPYLVIALAPVAVFLVVFGVLQALMPNAYYALLIWILQIINVSGAGGDLYVFFRFSRLPKDILVQDSGIAMTVFVREPEQPTE